MKKFVIILACILLVGCGSGSPAKSDYVAQAPMEAESSYNTTSAMASGAYEEVGYEEDIDREMEARESKLIYEANVSIETKEFEATIEKLNQKIKDCGGYIINESTSNYSRRSSSLTIRIPQENFDKFMNDSNELGNVTYSNTRAEDVTDYYYDTEARLHNYELQEQRLLELLEMAESLEDIMAIEARLSEVRYQIEIYTGQMKSLDKRVTYSTIYMDVNEVVSYQKVTFGSRFVEACKDTWRNALDFVEEVIISLVYLFPFILIGLALIFILKKVKQFIKLPTMNIFKKKDKNNL